MTEIITNNDDCIDSRAIIERIEELEAEQTEWNENKLVGWDEYDSTELDALRELTIECDIQDWPCGVTLIRYSYWVEYVEELLYDCGDLPRAVPDYIVIDWEATAENIAYDYNLVDFDGVDYYIRNN
jgi:hypothetical protein